MSRYLAVSWNLRSLQFVFAESARRSALRIVSAGSHEISTDPASDPTVILNELKQLVSRLHAEKSHLLILLNRGAIDSVTFPVPPATEDELPSIVRNMAQRELPGLSEDTPVDFIAYPPEADETRSVSAMAPVGEEYAQLRNLWTKGSFSSVRIIIGTHTLRAWLSEDDRQTSMIISRGTEAADVLLLSGELPILSRTIRLASSVSGEEINRYLITETQRTLISAGSKTSHPIEPEKILLIGNEDETFGLDVALSRHYAMNVDVARPLSLSDASRLSTEETSVVDSGAFASLLAAVFEASSGIKPVIDFASPRRPPEKINVRSRVLFVAGVLSAVIGAGWYYVSTQFSDIDSEIAGQVARLNELKKNVRETASKRRLVASLDSWAGSRFSWPDELNDLTERFPPRPGMIIHQLTVSPSGAGRSVASFRGTAKQPELIAELESQLRDPFHDLRIPGIREQVDGNVTTWTFQTSLNIRRRSKAQYSGLPPVEKNADSSTKSPRQKAEVQKKSAPLKQPVESDSASEKIAEPKSNTESSEDASEKAETP
ncbi:MAG: hypothetical protein ACK526_18865 [Planctomyces sp.]|jgi:hypothetical protein